MKTARQCPPNNCAMKWQRCSQRAMKPQPWFWLGRCSSLAVILEWRNACQAEVAFLNGRAPAYEDLSRMRYTRNVAEETMRLYPPVWVLSRTAIGDDEMGGFKIPAGSEILIFPVRHASPPQMVD